MTNDSRRILTLRLKGRYWHEVASGEKTVEFRLATEYWRKRLVGKHYEEIHLWLGYPSKSDTSKLLRRRWRLIAKETIQHDEFGPDPVEVFCIDVAQPVTS